VSPRHLGGKPIIAGTRINHNKSRVTGSGRPPGRELNMRMEPMSFKAYYIDGRNLVVEVD
jgi:hypothetical protein